MKDEMYTAIAIGDTGMIRPEDLLRLLKQVDMLKGYAIKLEEENELLKKKLLDIEAYFRSGRR